MKIGIEVEESTEKPISQPFEVKTKKMIFEILKKERVQTSLDFWALRWAPSLTNLKCVIYIEGASLENFYVYI